MKRDEYLKHLDRAFTQMPRQLPEQIELTFKRGEKAVNQRRKVLSALSVAAVIAVLCAAIALAAGKLVNPHVDNVVAARGSIAGVGEGGTSGTERTSPTPMPRPSETDAPVIVYSQPNSNYYHSVPDCSGMEGAVEWTEVSAVSVGKQPCPVCLGTEAEAAPELTFTPVPEEEYEELPVYYTPQGNYYHGYSQCSGMRNAEAHTVAQAVSDGKRRCPVCQPGEPDDIGLFVETFGCELEELYPGTRYAYTLLDTHTGAWEWMLYGLEDGGKNYGNYVNLEKRTVREGGSLPGHVGENLPRLSVRTSADNALTVWRRAPEPLHGMLREAEALLCDMPQMTEGVESTPLEYLTRTVVTFDEGSASVLAVTLWFEGAEKTTFRWILVEDSGYEMTLPEIEGEG